jgi:hypothetical protein
VIRALARSLARASSRQTRQTNGRSADELHLAKVNEHSARLVFSPSSLSPQRDVSSFSLFLSSLLFLP